jgi:hypothetical protein
MLEGGDLIACVKGAYQEPAEYMLSQKGKYTEI